MVTVTPSDALATYYCSVVKKADFDKLGSDEAYLDDDIDYLKAQAEKKQLTFKAYLETVIATGSEPIKFVTLEPRPTTMPMYTALRRRAGLRPI